MQRENKCTCKNYSLIYILGLIFFGLEDAHTADCDLIINKELK